MRRLIVAVKEFLSRERRLPSFSQLLALISIFGFALIVYVLGAAVMYYRLPTSTSLQKAFLGAEAWKRAENQAPGPSAGPPQSSILIDKPGRMDHGFTLYTTNSGPWAALINMKGKTVQRWQMPWKQAFPQWYRDNPFIEKQASWFGCHLDPNGDLLAVYHADTQVPIGPPGDKETELLNAHALSGYGLIKLDRDSKLRWTFAGRVHHALDVGPDGRIYALAQENATRKPANMDYVRVPHITDALVILSAEGKQLESVPLMEALRDSPFASTLQVLIEQNLAAEADYTHANSVMVLTKELAPRFPMFKEGQVLISLRNMSMLMVLDVPSRRAVWTAQGAWRKQHAAQFLDNGHLSLFDNEGDARSSRVLEYDPTNQALAWAYTGEDSKPFVASVRGTAQRLPGGNTLIVNPLKCRLFEVTPAREVVWEAECLEFTGQALEEKPFPYTPSINWARRYRPEQLKFITASSKFVD